MKFPKKAQYHVAIASSKARIIEESEKAFQFYF